MSLDPILLDFSPYGWTGALLEATDWAYHLKLFIQADDDEDPELLGSVWVANRFTAPTDEEEWRRIAAEDEEPPLPVHACISPEPVPRLRRRKLRLAWWPAGDGVALFEGDRLLASIPPWASLDDNGFPGYAAGAAVVHRLAWPLAPALDEQLRQLREADAFWREQRRWRTGDRLEEAEMAHLEARLGPHVHRFGPAKPRWPPRLMARFHPWGGWRPLAGQHGRHGGPADAGRRPRPPGGAGRWSRRRTTTMPPPC